MEVLKKTCLRAPLQPCKITGFQMVTYYFPSCSNTPFSHALQKVQAYIWVFNYFFATVCVTGRATPPNNYCIINKHYIQENKKLKKSSYISLPYQMFIMEKFTRHSPCNLVKSQVSKWSEDPNKIYCYLCNLVKSQVSKCYRCSREIKMMPLQPCKIIGLQMTSRLFLCAKIAFATL